MEEKCFNCKTTVQIKSKVYFCPYCLAQIRCSSCDDFLIQGAIGCASCGTPIGKSVDKKQTELNQIEFEQKGDLKKFKAIFTDIVGHDLVATFGSMVGSQIPKKKLLSLVNNKNSSTSSPHDEGQFQEVEFIEDTEDVINALNNVFKVDGENLILQSSLLKEKNKLDKEIRISVLVLLGYKYLLSNEQIKRGILNDILKKSRLNTANYRKWISRCDEIVQLKKGIISLTPSGNDKALKVLSEINDSNINQGNVDFSRASGTSRKAKNLSSEKITSINKSSKTPKSYLLKIIDEGFFKQRRTLSDIIEHLKNDHAITLKTNDISGHMGKFVNNKTLKREKGGSGYEYFI